MDLRRHFNWVAQTDERARRFQAGFHRQLIKLYRFHIAEGSRVLEWGCGAGELLRSLRPSHGVGIDISDAMIARAQAEKDTAMCEYREGNVLTLSVAETFDHIIMDYLTGYLPDIQTALEKVRNSSAHARTRLHITSLNTLWRLPLRWAQCFGFVVKQPPSNWLSSQDLINLLELSGWEVLRSQTEQLIPWDIPVISAFFNRFLVKLPFFRHFGISLHLIARPKMSLALKESPSCSVVVPARNEAGNISAALERIPHLGLQTEIIFVEGNSKDDTWGTIQRELSKYQGPHRVKAVKQPGKGKWDAVRTGFEHASGEVLVIQDADLTAPPEDLEKFYEAIVSGAAEFANGSRLVYPMESEAMKFLNLMGNKTFAIALSFVLGQPVKDSLCGTKMILRSDYNRLIKRIEVWGDFDPFGDYNLLFGASLLDLKIRDIPVRYKDRTYGETNISRFSHGWMLIKMIVFGLCRLKFI